MIKYSVVIPCFNAEDTIISCLSSVFDSASHGMEVEAVVIDDGSSDFSLDKIEAYCKNNPTANITVVRNSENKGVSYSRNRGIDKCSGDYILFLDSDDEFTSDKFQFLTKIVSKRKVDFLFHSWSVKGKESREGTGKLVKVSRGFIYWNLIKNHICTPCTLVAKDKVGEFDEELLRMEDLENWTRIMLKSDNIFFLDKSLSVIGHELNKGSGLSSDQTKMRNSELDMYIKLARRRLDLMFLLPVYIVFHLVKKLRDILTK